LAQITATWEGISTLSIFWLWNVGAIQMSNQPQISNTTYFSIFSPSSPYFGQLGLKYINTSTKTVRVTFDAVVHSTAITVAFGIGKNDELPCYKATRVNANGITPVSISCLLGAFNLNDSIRVGMDTFTNRPIVNNPTLTIEIL
jgi:hypothetical protein